MAWERGRSLRLSGRPVEALNVLRQSLPTQSKDYRLHDELGMALVQLNRQEEAIGSFLSALDLKPDFDEACNKIGSAFASRGLVEPAAIWFSRARQMNPTETRYLYPYGRVLLLLHQRQQAAEIFEQWRNAEPDNPIARHMSSAALGSESITKAPTDYICALFDKFALYFDQLLTNLNYCGPELVRDALRQVAETPVTGWDILDAGCGTGLVGLALKSQTRRLVGVDLSAGMLDMARQRNLYAELVQADIVEYLRNQSQRFDVVTAVDVLSYMGELNDFFSCAAGAVRPGGLVAITLEAHKTGDNYRLNPHGRFTHSRNYLQHAMEGSGFAVEYLAEDVMRHEANDPVPTWVAVGVVPAG